MVPRLDASNLEQMDLSTAHGSKVWVGSGWEVFEGLGKKPCAPSPKAARFPGPDIRWQRGLRGASGGLRGHSQKLEVSLFVALGLCHPPEGFGLQSCSCRLNAPARRLQPHSV